MAGPKAFGAGTVCKMVQLNDLSDTIETASAPLGLVDVQIRTGFYRNFGKRLFDIAVVLLLGVIAVPVVALLALWVARDGHAPFFLSDRVGRGGKTFRMLKLRTMVPNAEAQLARHLAADPNAAEEWKRTQKLKSDPRITVSGRVLRKSSLDELPQLWNVLVGDMSLVGPRPMMPNQRALYSGLSYYNLRPGVTGPWQVSDRNASTFAKRADFDRAYDRDLSFSGDIVCLFKTFGAVFRGTGY